MNDNSKNGKTFIVEVKSQQHNTWQGSISWVEGKKKENFRSVLELIKLLDSAVEGEDDKD